MFRRLVWVSSSGGPFCHTVSTIWGEGVIADAVQQKRRPPTMGGGGVHPQGPLRQQPGISSVKLHLFSLIK